MGPSVPGRHPKLANLTQFIITKVTNNGGIISLPLIAASFDVVISFFVPFVKKVFQL